MGAVRCSRGGCGNTTTDPSSFCHHHRRNLTLSGFVAAAAPVPSASADVEALDPDEVGRRVAAGSSHPLTHEVSYVLDGEVRTSTIRYTVNPDGVDGDIMAMFVVPVGTSIVTHSGDEVHLRYAAAMSRTGVFSDGEVREMGSYLLGDAGGDPVDPGSISAGEYDLLVTAYRDAEDLDEECDRIIATCGTDHAQAASMLVDAVRRLGRHEELRSRLAAEGYPDEWISPYLEAMGS